MLAKKLDVPVATFGGFHKAEVYISLGAVAGPLPWPSAPRTLDTSPL